MIQATPEYSTCQQPSPTSFLAHSSVLKLFLAERDEVRKLKIEESRKAGTEISSDQAFLLWIRHHRQSWLNSRKA